MLCAIWYHLHNLKNVKNTHGGVLLLVQLQAFKPATLLKVTLLHECFSRVLNCTNGTKLRQRTTYYHYYLVLCIRFCASFIIWYHPVNSCLLKYRAINSKYLITRILGGKLINANLGHSTLIYLALTNKCSV